MLHLPWVLGFVHIVRDKSKIYKVDENVYIIESNSGKYKVDLNLGFIELLEGKFTSNIEYLIEKIAKEENVSSIDFDEYMLMSVKNYSFEFDMQPRIKE